MDALGITLSMQSVRPWQLTWWCWTVMFSEGGPATLLDADVQLTMMNGEVSTMCDHKIISFPVGTLYSRLVGPHNDTFL